MKKRVVLIRSNPVSPDPPVEKAADALISNGYDVSIIGWDRGSNIIEKNEILSLEHGHVKIVRLGIPAMFDGGIKKNLLPLVKFLIVLRKWLKNHKNEYDIIHSFDFDTGFVANKIAKKYNKKLVYHILDFYIDSHNIPGDFFKSKIKKAEFAIINSADATIICTEKRREQIEGATPKKLEIIHNTPKMVCQTDDIFNEIKNTSRCKIVYVGILAASRFLKEIIKFVEQDDRFEFHIGGFGAMENEIIAAAGRCERIYYYGKLQYYQTLALEQSCDIMTAIYDPQVPNHKFAAPNKFYESLMLGKPIIMARNTGFDEIIESNHIGCLIEFDENGLSMALNKMIDGKDAWAYVGDRMKRLYKEQYSWLEMERRLVALYNNLQ